MPIDSKRSQAYQRAVLINKKNVYHVVISSATMISSLRMSAVNEIDTMCRNSFSKSTRDMIMMAAPNRLECVTIR